jgi:hypothetical protein
MEGLPMNDTRNTDTSTHKKLQMPTATEAEVTDKTDSNGIDRRNFLNCMAWVGTGLIWTMAGGVPKSKLFAATASSAAAKPMHGGVDFSFVQISDSHIGFNKAANQDIAQTLQLAINKINAMPVAGDFMLHTGDITQSAKPSEFDTAHQIIKSVKVNQTFFAPASTTPPPTSLVPTAIRQEHPWQRIVQLHAQRGTLHRSQQRSTDRCNGTPRHRAA